MGCFCVIVYAFCTVPWEESCVLLCDNVCFVQCRGTRAVCFCVIMYVLYGAVGRELAVFV